MQRVIIVLGNVDVLPEIDCDIIGVDYGAQFLAEHKIPMVCAIGDFDSVSNMNLIQEYAKEIVQLTPMKDETDCEVAIQWALSRYSSMDIYGGLGGRMDHEYANIALLVHRKYPITYYNDCNKMYRLENGSYPITKDKYRYISFFPLKESVISLSGVKYPLTKQKIDIQDIYLVSNEIISESMFLEIEGEVLVIQSNDRKK